jgi:hypothetical protein
LFDYCSFCFVYEQIYPAADALYSKAIEVLPDATLYANRSMVYTISRTTALA